MRYYKILYYLIFCTFFGCDCHPPDSFTKVDLYFENGTIYTVDDDDLIVQALAVKDGIIVFVGSAMDGKNYKEAAKEVIDLNGGMLLPGFIDGHVHTVTPEFFDFVHFNDFNLDLTLQTIVNYINGHPDQDIYYGYGYNVNIFEGEELLKGPQKERLDKICSNKPLIIYSLDGHAIWLNSKGFEYCKITKDTPCPTGGEIVKDEYSGELWGVLTNSAMSLVPDPYLEKDRLSVVLQHFQSDLNALGYTSIMTLPGNGFLGVYWDGYQQLERDGLLSLRVRGAEIIKPWSLEEDIAHIRTLKNKYNSELVKITAAKFFIDGIIISRTSYLMEPYQGSDFCGESMWEQSALNSAIATMNREGFQTHTHVMGDASAKMALDAAQYANCLDCRNVLTHLPLVDPNDFPRFKALNVIPVVQPYWFFKQLNYWEPIEYAVLGPRAEREWPLQSYINHGAKVVFSSDYPVSTPPNPFVAIEIGVTRNQPGIADIDNPAYLLWPEERSDVKNMIRGFTANAAYSIFAEAVTGSLEVGKSADLIVIDQDIFSIYPSKISNTKVLRTYFKGKLVYGRE